MSRAGYLRKLVCGYVPKELPPLEYCAIMNQLYELNGKLDEIKYLCNDHLKGEEFALLYTCTKEMILDLHNKFFDCEKIK